MSKADEKFWNFVYYSFWGTDEELKQFAPWIIGIVIVILVAVVIGSCAGGNHDGEPIPVPAIGMSK